MKKFWYILMVFWCENILSNPLIDNNGDLTQLHFVHINDFHARFEEISLASGSCKNAIDCIGGFSRMYEQINSILSEKPETVLLNAGDNFQGTMYYNLFKYNITAEFLNTLPFDAMVLGNHEFDDGLEGVIPFMKMSKAPIVVSNMNDTLEPQIQGLYQKSTIIERNGKKLGIIGVIVRNVDALSNAGNLSFFDESESVNAEAERLVKEEDVFTNIVLSHSGYDIERMIAVNAKNKICCIFGGHTHSFLYTGDNPPGPDQVIGPYPTVETRNVDGKMVLVTQASSYTKFLGNITIYFDKDGNVVNWSGAPIYLDHSLPRDETIDEKLKPWTQKVNAIGNEEIGYSLVTLDQTNCRDKECTLGNFAADAFVFGFMKLASNNSWTGASICLLNSGGLRASIMKGAITHNDLVDSQPFGHTLISGDLTGKQLRNILEYSAIPAYSENNKRYVNLLQVSGLRVTLDLRKSPGSKVTELKVRCQSCEIPRYSDVNDTAIYRVIVPTYLQHGGDGFVSITNSLKNIKGGFLDIDLLKNYIRTKTPVYAEEEGRITIIEP